MAVISVQRALFVSPHRRQLNPEFAAIHGVRFHADLSAHPFHGFAHNREADSSAFVFAFRMDAFEQSEQPMLMFRLDADAVVADEQSNMAVIPLGPNFAM